MAGASYSRYPGDKSGACRSRGGVGGRGKRRGGKRERERERESRVGKDEGRVLI